MRKAIAWYLKAAMNEYPRAQSALGFLYLRGVGLRQDIPTAIDWLTRAAENRDPSAAGAFYTACKHGDYVKKGIVTAVQWWLKFKEFERSGGELVLHGLESAEIRHLPELIGDKHPWNGLRLSDFDIDDDAVRAIAKILRRDTRMKTLSLGYKPIGVAGLLKIARAVRKNFSVIRVSGGAHHNEQQKQLVARIRGEGERNRRIGSLRTIWNTATVEKATYALPAELVRLLGEALIVQDQKLGDDAPSEENTRLRLAMLLLSLQDLAEKEMALPWKQ